MRKHIFFLSFLTGIVLVSACSYLQKVEILPEITTATPIENCSYRVVNTYPHDPMAFTQGLVYDNGKLYEGTGLRGSSSLRRVELETGKILQVHNLEEKYFGEGITVWQDRLIQLTWMAQTGFVYDQETFVKLQNFTYPTEGWGLTHNGQELIMSDGSNNLYFLDPNTFKEVKRVQVYDGKKPVGKLNELEYINGEILANVWFRNRIARISPTTGQILGWIDLSGLLDPTLVSNQDAVLNGIAYDRQKERLLVTGKLWPKLFEIETLCEEM